MVQPIMKRLTIEDYYDFVSKVVLVGDSGVGKTNILSRYIKDEFMSESKATLGVEFATKILVSNQKRIRIQIWDTAGQERYRAITNSYYVNAKGAIVVFDITKHSSFESVDKWVNELREISGDSINIILVGNKLDRNLSREVPIKEAEEKASKLRVEYIETTALNNVNIGTLFQRIVDMIYENYFSKLVVDEESEIRGSKIESILEQKEERKCSC